jgi:hypothetical protein
VRRSLLEYKEDATNGRAECRRHAGAGACADELATVSVVVEFAEEVGLHW